MVLSEVKKNGTYHVKQLRGFGDVHRHLEDMGFLHGECITVVSRISETHYRVNTLIEELFCRTVERGIGENSQRRKEWRNRSSC